MVSGPGGIEAELLGAAGGGEQRKLGGAQRIGELARRQRIGECGPVGGSERAPPGQLLGRPAHQRRRGNDPQGRGGEDDGRRSADEVERIDVRGHKHIESVTFVEDPPTGLQAMAAYG